MDNCSKVTLSKFKYYVSMRLNELLSSELGELPECEIINHANFIADSTHLGIRGFVWGTEHEMARVEYPADWLQALKERFAPEWFKKRYPVKKTVKVIQAMELYPKLAFPKEKHAIHLRVITEQ